MPFLVVPGKPVSSNFRGTKRYLKYRLLVAAYAASTYKLYWPSGNSPVFQKLVTMAVEYIHTSGRIVDVDNTLKAIQDGQIGFSYPDDSEIRQVTARRTTVANTFKMLAALPPEVRLTNSHGRPSLTNNGTSVSASFLYLQTALASVPTEGSVVIVFYVSPNDYNSSILP